MEQEMIRRSLAECDFIAYDLFWGESIFYTGIINPDRYKPTRRRCLDGGGWSLCWAGGALCCCCCSLNNNKQQIVPSILFFSCSRAARITDCSFFSIPPDDQHRSDRWRWLAWQPRRVMGASSSRASFFLSFFFRILKQKMSDDLWTICIFFSLSPSQRERERKRIIPLARIADEYNSFIFLLFNVFQ